MKKLVALILTVILAVGAIFMVGCGNGNNGGDQTANSGSGGSSSSGSDQTQQVTTYPGVRSVRLSMGAMSETEATTTSTGEQTEAYSERVIVATILPTSALQKVDYTMTWQSNGSSEGIDEYLTLTQETDGSPKAVVRCTKDFSAKGAILITATARAGGLSDTLTATFLGVTREMNFGYIKYPKGDEYVDCELNNTEERGDYYMLYTCYRTYNPGGTLGNNGNYTFSGYGLYSLKFIDFYGDQKGVGRVDLELSSTGYVYLMPRNEIVLSSTGYPIVIRTPLHWIGNVIDFEDSYNYNGGELVNSFGFCPGFLYGETVLDYASYLPGGLLLDDGSAFDSRGVSVASDLSDLKKYTVVDYEIAYANGSFDEGVIGSYTGAEIESLSEQSLKECCYELKFVDEQTKLFTVLRFWIGVGVDSVDTGSDIVF